MDLFFLNHVEVRTGVDVKQVVIYALVKEIIVANSAFAKPMVEIAQVIL